MLLALVAGLTAQAQTFTPYSNAVVALNPLGFWPLQETAPTPAWGASYATNLGSLSQFNTFPNNGNGAYVGGVFPGFAGPLANGSDKSCYFDQTSGEVIVPYSPSLVVPSSSFTAECWVKVQFTNTATEYIMSYGNFGNSLTGTPVSGYSGFRLSAVGGGLGAGRLTMALYNTNSTTVALTLQTSNTAAGYLQSNTWNHVAVVFQQNSSYVGGTNLQIYVNGVVYASNVVGTLNSLGYPFIPDDGTGHTALSVGCLLNESGYFEGNIAEVALYPSALPAADVLAHYNAGKSAATPATGTGSYTNLVLNESPAPYVYLRLNDNFSYPVANNYGILGASGNGFYLPGTVPNGATGPATLGSCTSVSFQANSELLGGEVPFTRDAVVQTTMSPMVGQALNVGNYVAISPGTNNQWNIITNSALLPANTAGTGSNMTVMAWVQVPSQPVNWIQAAAARNDAASWRMNVVPVSAPGSASTSSNGFPDFVDGGNDNQGYVNQINDGNWHFWTGVFNCANSNCALYVDGALISTMQETRPSFNQYSPLIFGVDPNNNGRNFVGNLCGMAVFTNALTAAQIDQVYGSTYGGIITEPLASVSYVAGSIAPITLTCAAQGAVLQWYKGTPGSGTPLANTGEYSGVTTENLVITPPLSSGDFTSYYLQVGDGVSQTANSTAVTLTQVAIPSGPYDLAVSNLNPVAYWPLNEATGRIAMNYTTNGAVLNGIYANAGSTPLQLGVSGPSVLGTPNATQFLPCNINTSGQSRETRTGVIIENAVGDGLLDMSNSVTVAMWVNEPVVHGTFGIQELYGQQDSTLIRFSTYGGTAGGTDNQMDFVDGGNDIIGGPAVNDGNWHLWVGTYQAQTASSTNRFVSVYLDGILVNTGYEGGNNYSALYNTIGSAPDDTGRNFVGSICDVAVFNTNLTTAQVASLYNSVYGGVVGQPAANKFYVSGTASPVILTADVEGSSIQWYFGTPGSGTPVGTGVSGEISGANTQTLTITPIGIPPAIPAADVGSYYVVVGNGATIGTSTLTQTTGATTLNVLSATGGYATAVLALNPIGYWPLNEGVGTNTAFNYSPTYGAALNGVYSAVAACPLQQGVAGPTYLAMGPNNFGTMFSTQDTQSSVTQTGVIINDPAVMNVLTNVSVAMWVNKPVSGGTWGIQEIFGQADNDLIRYSAYGGTAGGTDNQEDFVDGGGDITGGPAINDGLWHLWTGTYNGTNRAVITYLDGKQIDSGTDSANTTSGTVTCIGSAPEDTGRNFYGSVCDVAFFTNTLTPAQVASLFSAAGVPVSITVNPAPTVIANAGSVATLGTVAAAGSTPITYLWYSGTPGSGTALTAGASYPNDVTNTSLVIDPVAGTAAGTYYVVASGPFNSVASAEVVLTVNTAVSATIYAGRSPTFSVAPGATSYQWSTNGHIVAGATSSTLTLSGLTVAANNGETVSCLINGTLTSATFTLDVVSAPTDAYAVAVLLDSPQAYFRLNEPDNGSGDNGVVTRDFISGNNGVYVDANPGVNSELGLGSNSFPYTAPLPANTNTAAAFGTLGQVTTGGYTGYSNSYAGYIPIDFSTPKGSNAAFSVEAWVYGEAGQHNGAIVTKGYGQGVNNGAQGFFEQFTLQNSLVGTSGSRYEFSVRDALGNLATFETTSGVIGSTPGWQHIVGVYDEANTNIVLYVNGLAATSGATITKPIPSNGVMTTIVPVSIGAKQVEAINGNYDGQWNGTVADVAIYPKALTSNEVQNHYFAAGIAPIFIVEPTNDLNIGFLATTNPPQGTSVTLKALGFGSPTLHYQWYDYNNGGTPIAVSSANEPGNTGSTTSTLTLVNVNNGLVSGSDTLGTGTFFCTVSNPYGTTNSATVTVSPAPGPPIIIVDLPSVSYALLGQSAVFSLDMTGTFPQTNAWYYTPLSGPTVRLQNAGRYTITAGASPTLTVANVTLADQGTYQFFATNAFSYPNPTSSTASALVVENEPTFNGTGNGWTLNSVAGTTTFPSISGNTLVITQNAGSEANSFFFDTPMYCGAFQASFTYQMGAYTTGPADGFTFCLQNDPAGVNALGGAGGALGYSDVENNATPYITNSVAVGFDIYAGHTRGWEVINQGYSPYNYTAYAPVSLISGDQVNIVIYYDGNKMNLTMTDPSAGTTYASNIVVGPISQYLGSNTALIGFTGGNGGDYAQQSISSFLYVPIPVLSAVTSAGNVVISWPSGTGLSAYVLESSTTVNGTYTTVSATPTVVNGNYQVTVPVPTGAGNTFYQLKLANP